MSSNGASTLGMPDSLSKQGTMSDPAGPTLEPRTLASPGPWRPSSIARSSSPALVSDNKPWASPSKKALGVSSSISSSLTSSSTLGNNVLHNSPYQNNNRSSTPMGEDYLHNQGPGSSLSKSASPVLTSGSFTRTQGVAVDSLSSPHLSTTQPQPQPLNLETLVAKFADSPTKEKYARLNLSAALTPSTFQEKDRRPAPMGSFSTPATHIKVQRTASLHYTPNNMNHSPKSALGVSSKLQTGHLAPQPSDMRRTASHNSAFSSSLGSPVGSNHDSKDTGSNNNNSNNTFSQGNTGSLSQGLAPFSLSNMTPPRSSLNPHDFRVSYDTYQPKVMSSPLATDKHPLQHAWTLHYDVSAGYSRQASSAHNYVNMLQNLGTFSTLALSQTQVEQFARYFNWIEKPHKMENSANYHLFKDGIKPVWEDPANANGGRWILTLQSKNSDLLDRCWMELAYALVGEQLDANDDICGAVLSRRTKADRLAVWVRDRENVTAINGIGKRLIKILDLSKERISLEFQVTTNMGLSGPPRTYISLDDIRRELTQETTTSFSDDEKTPALSSTSHSTTPMTANVSPVTPRMAPLMDSKSNLNVPHAHTSGSGLLISVNGDGV
ncbi:MAG: translation initiation factor eIF 4e-like domain-containing protein [Podila humilis]|nr:MAG: translation initiation factor eIF 4e-like domain-containing protein [Podila humilis]